MFVGNGLGEPTLVVLGSDHLAGWCWRTKSSKRGMPWGCLLSKGWASEVCSLRDACPERDFRARLQGKTAWLLWHAGTVPALPRSVCWPLTQRGKSVHLALAKDHAPGLVITGSTGGALGGTGASQIGNRKCL